MQYRGSAPFFWGHKNIGYSPKPEIVLHEELDRLFSVTDKHFEHLINVYGAPIKILNLVKKDSKNERKLGEVYKKYMMEIEKIPKKFMKNKVDLTIEWFDFFQLYNSNEELLLAKMQEYGAEYLKEVRPTMLDFSLDDFGVVFSHTAGDQFAERRPPNQLCGLPRSDKQRDGLRGIRGDR